MRISADILAQTILNQIDTLQRIVVDQGGRMNHIKPHGALYNDLVVNEELSLTFLNIIREYKKRVKLFVPYASVIARVAVRDGFAVVYEAFADRNYNDDLSLVSRDNKNAVITDPKVILEHVLEVKNNGTIRTITGKHIAMSASTFCLHSDTVNVIESIKYLNQNLH
jgi:UPF0271 protein